MENVKDLLRTADALFTEMNKNSGDWDELRRRIMPRMEGKARQQEQANEMTAASSFSPVAHKSLFEFGVRSSSFYYSHGSEVVFPAATGGKG